MFKLLQRLGVPQMLQIYWQSSSTGSQNCEQAPQLFWGVTVPQFFTPRGSGDGDVQAWWYPIQQNSLRGVEGKAHKGRSIPGYVGVAP